MKDHEKKLELHNNYKNHRNLLSTLIKQSKHKYFNKYFEDNWNNMKNTWKGIKNIITLNNLSSDAPRTLSVNDVTIMTLVVLPTSLTIISVQLRKKQRITSINFINILII